jgi:hypothetical protein
MIPRCHYVQFLTASNDPADSIPAPPAQIFPVEIFVAFRSRTGN